MAKENAKRNNPMAQSGNMVNEAPIVMFTEFSRKIGEEYAVVHLTLRDVDDDNLYSRLEYAMSLMSQLGFAHSDAPKKMQYPARGSGGGFNKNRPEPTPIKEIANPDGTLTGRGDFEVGSLALFVFNKRNQDGTSSPTKNIRVYGVNGEECVAWDGKALDAVMKADGNLAKEFTNWADWKQDEQKVINWKSHGFMAHCKKSAVKTDGTGKVTGGKWYVDSFEVTNKTV